jgi:hypothetical protein
MEALHGGHLIHGDALAIVINAKKNNPGAGFTVRSKETGKDYTFKIARRLFKEYWYTHVSVETGYLSFTKLGHYFNGQLHMKHQVVSTPAADAVCWVLRQVEKQNFDKLDANIELMHFGKCIVCGKPLTDADSIQIGIGPVCRNIKNKQK